MSANGLSRGRLKGYFVCSGIQIRSSTPYCALARCLALDDGEGHPDSGSLQPYGITILAPIRSRVDLSDFNQ